MKGHHAGFTLVEMLIVIAIFGFVLAGSSQMFVSMLKTHRQQSRIAETNIEGVIGLELFRQDIQKAGYGLPWNGTFNYSETAIHGLNDSPSSAPRGIVHKNAVGWNGTDYLVIKAANVAISEACAKWTFLMASGSPTTVTTWTPASENPGDDDRVIVLSPGTLDSSTARSLVTLGTGAYYAQFDSVDDFAAPAANPETRVVYGIDPDTNLRRPFNRADYYVSSPSTGMPQRCAAGTGNLYKSVENQADDDRGGGMPLLDCVADMQVVFGLDNDADNDFQPGVSTDGYSDTLAGLSAQDIRTKVKQVRVFILAHEGQRDSSYKHPVDSIYVGDTSVGREFDFAAQGVTDWRNYRWKVYTLIVKPDNLR